MKRTTVSLPDELAAGIESEGHRLSVPATEVIRRAVELYLSGGERGAGHRLPFVALGRSGRHDTARRAEEILAAEWRPSSPSHGPASRGR